LQNVQHMLAEPNLDLEEDFNIEAKVAYADAAQFAEKVKEWMAAERCRGAISTSTPTSTGGMVAASAPERRECEHLEQ
jgi:hypothetical protein